MSRSRRARAGCLSLVRSSAGAVAHLAETVETRALRGRKRRAKTDRQDALWLRELLAEGRLPEAWIPPEHVRQWRSRLHLRKALIDERTQWLLRIRSTLYHHGLSGGAPGEIAGPTGRRVSELLCVRPGPLVDGGQSGSRSPKWILRPRSALVQL